MNLWRRINTYRHVGTVSFIVSFFSALLSFLAGTKSFHGAVGIGATISVVAWIGLIIIHIPAIYLYFTHSAARRMGVRQKACFIIVVVTAAFTWGYQTSWETVAAGIAGMIFGPTFVLHLLKILILGKDRDEEPGSEPNPATADGGTIEMQPLTSPRDSSVRL